MPIALFYCCEKVFTINSLCGCWGMSLSEKEDFYSHLNLRDITDADYVHANRVCKDFKIKIYRIIMIYTMYSC